MEGFMSNFSWSLISEMANYQRWLTLTIITRFFGLNLTVGFMPSDDGPDDNQNPGPDADDAQEGAPDDADIAAEGGNENAADDAQNDSEWSDSESIEEAFIAAYRASQVVQFFILKSQTFCSKISQMKAASPKPKVMAVIVRTYLRYLNFILNFGTYKCSRTQK